MARIGEPDRWWVEPEDDPFTVPVPTEPVTLPVPEPVLVPA